MKLILVLVALLRCYKINKDKQKKRHDRKRAAKKRATMYYCTPRPHYAATKLSHVCLAHTLRCCKKKTQNQGKHDRKRTARKTNNHVPPALTTSQPNSLMSDWRTRVAACAAIIAMFAFVRWNGASPLPLSSAASSRTPK